MKAPRTRECAGTRSAGSGVVRAPRSALRAPHCKSRRGLTLLEVIVSLAIFLFAMVAIGRLISMGSDRARDIQGREIQLCQAKLAEIVSGITPMQSADGTFDEEPDWHWNVDCQNSGISALWNVKVTVSRQHSDGSKTQAVLTQMVLDPNQRGSTLDPDPTASSSTSSDSSGGNGSGSPTGSGSPSSSEAGGGMGKPSSTGSKPPSTTPAPSPGGSGPKSFSPPSSGSPARPATTGGNNSSAPSKGKGP